VFPLHDDNPTRIVPVVTVTIIVTCVLVFIWQISLGQQFERAIYSFGAIPSVVFGIKALPAELEIVPPWTTVLTSMFMHGGWMHLIGNMLYFWIFGNNVEDAMGHVRFVIFYMLCGIAAFLAQSLPAPQSVIPMVGASGAISGVLGAYLLLYPHARVLVAIPLGFFIYTTRLAAGWVLAFWFVLQIISSALTGAGEGGVAFGAHIGGFVAGMVLIPLFKYKTYPLFAPPRS
jgi:membrane associated rhomboid family serine protease